MYYKWILCQLRSQEFWEISYSCSSIAYTFACFPVLLWDFWRNWPVKSPRVQFDLKKIIINIGPNWKCSSFIYYILDVFYIFALGAETESVVDGIPMNKLSINTEESESLFDYDEDELVVGMISEVRSFSTLPTLCISGIEIRINLNFGFNTSL